MHKLIPDWYRISSVQHNRIDQFNQIYIKKIYPHLTREGIELELSAEYKYVNVIDNQIKGGGLGRSLPKKDDPLPLVDIFDCIESGKINLFIFDNFAELLFKLFRHKELKTPMFINERYLTKKAILFDFENSFMNKKDVHENYLGVFKYITSKNPTCKITFIPFPVKLKGNDALCARGKEHIAILNELKKTFNNLHVIPEKEITPSDLLRDGDIYHFNDSCYFEYARDIFKDII